MSWTFIGRLRVIYFDMNVIKIVIRRGQIIIIIIIIIISSSSIIIIIIILLWILN